MYCKEKFAQSLKCKLDGATKFQSTLCTQWSFEKRSISVKCVL